MAKRDDDYDFDNLPVSLDRPPLTSAVLSKYIQTLKQRPKCFPDGDIAAANWWMKMQEPAAKNETPFKRQIQEKQFWVTPYTDRVLYTLQKFCNLSNADQTIVLGAFEDGVFWRGDDMQTFFMVEKSIYAETMKIKEVGIKAYKDEAKQYAKSVMLKMRA